MRLDVRKSLVLGDAKQMTPTVNLMNPQWRQSFQSALEKLGEEFKTTTLQVPEDVQKAVSSEANLDRTRVGVAPGGQVGNTAESRPEAQAYVRRMQSAAGRTPNTYAPPAEHIQPMPNTDRVIQASSLGGQAGNMLALALQRVPTSTWTGRGLHLLGDVANFGVPAAAGAIAGTNSNNVADLGYLRSEAPDYRAASLVADAEAQRLRGEDGQSNELGQFYAKDRPIFDAYGEARPGMSTAERNAYGNSEMGVSMSLANRGAEALQGGLLRRTLAGVPVMGPVMGGGISALGALRENYNARKANARIKAENVDRAAAGQPLVPEVPEGTPWGDWSQHAYNAAAPLAAHVGAKAPTMLAEALAKPGAARIGWGAIAGQTGKQLAGRGALAATGAAALPATLAANALSGAYQLATATPESINQARSDLELDRRGVSTAGTGTVAGRTLMGDPIGAATALDAMDPNSDVSQAARNDVRNAQISPIETGDEKQPIVMADKLKQHLQMRDALQSAPSIPNSITQQLVANAQMDVPALKYQSIRPQSRLSAEDSSAHAHDIAAKIESGWGLPQNTLTDQAKLEIAQLVQTLGPDAATKALVPTADRSHRLDEMRLQAILNDQWLRPDIYNNRIALYNHHFGQ